MSISLFVSYSSNTLGNTTYLKPAKAPDLSKFSIYNKNFVKFNSGTNEYQITQNIEDLRIVWENHKITGTILLKGKYNLCYLDGLYYFLDEIQYLYDDVYRYKLVRWFWVNDCLNNSKLRITGVLQKTNQTNIVSSNIIFTTPIMQSGNELTFYNIKELTDNENDQISIPILEPKNFSNSPLSHFLGFSIKIDESEFETIQMPEKQFAPNLNKFPFLIVPSIHRNWKGFLIFNLVKFLQKNNLSLWDINAEIQTKTLIELSTKYPLNKNKHYIITSDGYTGLRHFAKSKVRNKQVSNIDLSSLTDVKKISASLETINPNFSIFEAIDEKSRVVNIRRILKNCGVISTDTNTIKSFNNQILCDSNLGDLKSGDDVFFEHEYQAEIVIGYKNKEDGSINIDDPIYYKFENSPHSYLINLSKYKISHSSSEYFSNVDEEYIDFLVGKNKLFDDNSFVNKAVTALQTKISDSPILYSISFKNIPLEQGFFVNGNSYITYAYFQPMKSIQQYSDQSEIIEDTKEFKEIENFAQLASKEIWWSKRTYTESATESKKIKDLEGYGNDLTYSKSEVKDIFVNLLKNFENALVGNLLDGVIIQFPPDYFSNSSKQSASELVNSNSYLGDELKPETLKQFVYIQPLASNEKISSKNYNIRLHKDEWDKMGNDESIIFKFEHKGQIVEQLGEFISYKDLKNKIDEWFKYWKDRKREGDFLLNKKVGCIKVSDDLTWLCYDISKIHNGKQYKITLLFKRDHNENNIKTMSTKITFRELYHVSASNGNNSGNFGVWFESEISRLLWPFYICSVVDGFELGEHKVDIEKGNKGWAYYHEIRLHFYERYYNVIFKVPTIENNIKSLEYAKVNKNRIFESGMYYPYLKSMGLFLGTQQIEWEDGDGLYDLVGTNFYVYKYREYYELIVKNNAESINEKQKEERKIVTESPLNDLDKVINSQNIIYVFGETIPIKWRGFLNNLHKFDNFSITPIELSGTNQAYDVYEVIIKTSCDFIKKYLKIMKEQSTLLSQVSISEFENISYRIREEQRLSALSSKELDLEKDKFYANLRNTKTDIDEMIKQRDLGLMANILSFLKDAVSKDLGGAVSTIISAYSQYSETDANIRKATRNYEISSKFGEEEFKIKEDRLNITYNLLEAHHRKILLNLETNTRISIHNESSIYRAVQEKFKTGDMYLINIRPEGRQLEEIKKYYSMFGYDITLYDYSITNEDLNKGLIMKFSQVTDICGIENSIIAEVVKNIFESGFKII